MQDNTMKQFLPTIIDTCVEDNKVTLLLHISPDIFYFQGHFPKKPILPGIVQIHWVVHYAKQFFDFDRTVNLMNNIKFTNIIMPDNQIWLTLDFSLEKRVVFYRYSTEKKVFSSGCVYQSDQE